MNNERVREWLGSIWYSVGLVLGVLRSICFERSSSSPLHELTDSNSEDLLKLELRKESNAIASKSAESIVPWT